MKTRVLWLLIAICLLLGIGSFWYLTNLQPTITEVDFNTKINRLILVLEKDWPEMPATLMQEEQHSGQYEAPYDTQKNGQYDGIDYTVLDNTGEVLYRTREGLSESISQASANYDVIRDITVNDITVGRLLVHNASAEVLQSRYRAFAKLFLAMSCMLAAAILMYTFYLQKKVVRPFRDMQDFAQQIAMGNLDAPLRMDRENVFGAFTQSFDIMREELKAARLREEKAVSSRKELIAQLSHDIKTPVASIKAMAEVMELSAEDEEQKETSRAINAKADQIDKLISNLFHATLEELEHLEVNCEEIPSDELLQIVREADHKKLVASLEIPECVVIADRLRISQVIGNLISNSYKYAGTQIFVNGSFAADQLMIEISDLGGGVPEEELDVILEKFRRGSNSTGKDGAGLGLYISAYLIQKMGGSLCCQNRDGGFTVLLQLKLA